MNGRGSRRCNIRNTDARGCVIASRTGSQPSWYRSDARKKEKRRFLGESPSPREEESSSSVGCAGQNCERSTCAYTRIESRPRADSRESPTAEREHEGRRRSIRRYETFQVEW